MSVRIIRRLYSQDHCEVIGEDPTDPREKAALLTDAARGADRDAREFAVLELRERGVVFVADGDGRGHYVRSLDEYDRVVLGIRGN